MFAVGLDPDGAGGEPHAGCAAAAGLEPGKTHLPAFTFARGGVVPVLQRPGNPIQAGVERLLRTLRPPRGHLTLGLVPHPPQRRQTPPQTRGPLLALQTVAALRPALTEVDPHRGQRPIDRKPRGPAMT